MAGAAPCPAGIGFAIVADAFDTLDDDLSCIEEADTPQELDECNEGGS